MHHTHSSLSNSPSNDSSSSRLQQQQQQQQIATATQQQIATPAMDAAPPPAASSLTLYIDLMSQPSRACYILVKAFNLPVAIKLLRLDKGEHRTSEYKALNPLAKVPFLADGATGLRLPESAAIMAYLADRFGLPPAWHPPTRGEAAAHSSSSSSSADVEATAQQRARFEAALHWFHTSIRLGCTRLVFHTVIGPRVFKVPGVPAVAAHGQQVLQQALGDLEHVWLDGRPFMAGQQASVPDLLAVCELEQLRMLVAEPSAPQLQQLLEPHERVRAWMAAVRDAVGAAVFDDAHAKLAAATAALTPPAPRL